MSAEFPDRLTLASTGGPVTGCDEGDRAFWQSNTRKLEDAGAMGVEYSLSCPQGGDGTNGDLVSQSAELTAKIVGWVMETGDPDVPKLFKLTGAVTAIQPIIRAIQEVLRPPSRQEGRCDAREQLPVARVPALGGPPLGGGGRDRDVGRGRAAHQLPHAGTGGRHGRHGFRERRAR